MELLIFLGLFIASALVNLCGRSILWKELQVISDLSDKNNSTNLFVATINYVIASACVALIYFGSDSIKTIVFTCMCLGIIFKSIQMFQEAGFNQVTTKTKIKASVFWIAQAIGFTFATYFLWLTTHSI